MDEKLRVGVLASGGGTDLQSIIDASEQGMIDAEVVVVISDTADAYCLQRAKKHTIASYCIDAKTKQRADQEQEINDILLRHSVELVVGAGYMRVLSSSFVKKWYGKLINIHPALLPSFKGINGQGDALEYGVKIAGCTTHFMDDEMDHGPIILQAAVQVLDGDDRQSLAARILDVEHQILPRTIQLFAEKRLEIQGRIVKIRAGDSWIDTNECIPDVLYSQGY